MVEFADEDQPFYLCQVKADLVQPAFTPYAGKGVGLTSVTCPSYSAGQKGAVDGAVAKRLADYEARMAKRVDREED